MVKLSRQNCIAKTKMDEAKKYAEIMIKEHSANEKMHKPWQVDYS